MQAFPAGHVRSLLARPLIDQVVNSTTAGSMTSTAGSRFIEALIKSIGELIATKAASYAIPDSSVEWECSMVAVVLHRCLQV
jgi:hypothetical protein